MDRLIVPEAFDKDGFLRDTTDWTPELAEAIAARDGIRLTDAHWQVIHLARDFHAAHTLVPTMRVLVRLLRENGKVDGVGSAYLMTLFTGNTVPCLARIAGLPRPRNCL